MSLMTRWLGYLIICSTLWWACSGVATVPEAPAFDAGTIDQTPPDLSGMQLTYYGHAKAIIEKKCQNCHQKGGVAPFELGSYEAVSRSKSLIKNAVETGRMPPWQADPACNEYKNDFSLSLLEKHTLLQWIGQGAKKGEPTDYKAPAPEKGGLSRVDLTLKMKDPYTPKKKPDDYRCFVIDWPEKKTRYVTGFSVTPGNRQTVHHVIVFNAEPRHAQSFVKKDQAEEGAGYECFGGPGGQAKWLGGWVPGERGNDYPADTGIRVEPGSKVIVQVHYNTATGDGPDQTAVHFKLEDKVKTPSSFRLLIDRRWSGSGMMIPAGKEQVRHAGYFSSKSSTQPVQVYFSMIHMHTLGKSARMLVDRKEGPTACIQQILRWDFNWQIFAHLKKPITLNKDDRIYLECNWDNSAANQPSINGEKKAPRDVYWGDGSYDEMCLGILYVSGEDDD